MKSKNDESRGRPSKALDILSAIDFKEGSTIEEVCKKAEVDRTTVNRHLKGALQNIIQKKEGKLYIKKTAADSILEEFYGEEATSRHLSWFQEHYKDHEYSLLSNELDSLDGRGLIRIKMDIKRNEKMVVKTFRGGQAYLQKPFCAACFKLLEEGQVILTCGKAPERFYHTACLERELQTKIAREGEGVPPYLCHACLKPLVPRYPNYSPSRYTLYARSILKMPRELRKALYRFLERAPDLFEDETGNEFPIEYGDDSDVGAEISVLEDVFGSMEHFWTFLGEYEDFEQLSKAWAEFNLIRKKLLEEELSRLEQEIGLVRYSLRLHWVPLFYQADRFYHLDCWEMTGEI